MQHTAGKPAYQDAISYYVLSTGVTMTKKLCSWKKADISDNAKEFRKLVGHPKYYCTKCGRVAKDSKYICKPDKL
jgi:hypothetical protein